MAGKERVIVEANLATLDALERMPRSMYLASIRFA